MECTCIIWYCLAIDVHELSTVVIIIPGFHWLIILLCRYSNFSTNSLPASTTNANSVYHANNLVKPPFHNPVPSSSNLPRYDPYAPPRRPLAAPSSSTSSTAISKPLGTISRNLPPFSVEPHCNSYSIQGLPLFPDRTNTIACRWMSRYLPITQRRVNFSLTSVESASSTDRRSQQVSFTLTGEQISKLRTPGCDLPLLFFR